MVLEGTGVARTSEGACVSGMSFDQQAPEVEPRLQDECVATNLPAIPSSKLDKCPLLLADVAEKPLVQVPVHLCIRPLAMQLS
eukprot:668701-Prymnesium_polylepis.1